MSGLNVGLEAKAPDERRGLNLCRSKQPAQSEWFFPQQIRLNSELPGTAGAALGPQSGAAARFTGFLVILSSPHFFLNTAPFNQFAKAANCFLDRLAIPYVQLNHTSSLEKEFLTENFRRLESCAAGYGNPPVYLHPPGAVYPNR